MKPLKWREFKAKPKPEAKEEREIQRTGQWYGLDRWEETKLCWERTSSLVGKTKIEKMVGVIKNEHGQDRIRAMSKEDDSVIIQVRRYEDDCGGLEKDTQGTVVDRNDVSSARSFPQNFVSAEYYFEDIGNMMGIKHDGKQARRD
ncbi:hypothetical protein YC2023_108543 [Brassica napus]